MPVLSSAQYYLILVIFMRTVDSKRFICAERCEVVVCTLETCFADKIRTQENARAVTILDNEMFILASPSSSELRIYDANSYTYRGAVQLSVRNVVGMVACGFHHCLYIADGDVSCIIRVEMPSKLRKWKVNDMDGKSVISLTSSRCLLVVCPKANNLKLFSTDGTLQSVVQLRPQIVNLTFAVELTPGKYVLSHGSGGDTLHRVCVVDDEGKILHIHGGLSGSYPTLLSCPGGIVVDKNGFVYVDDVSNQRLIVLTPNLKYVQCLTGVFKQGYRRLSMDKESGNVFVMYWYYTNFCYQYLTDFYEI